MGCLGGGGEGPRAREGVHGLWGKEWGGKGGSLFAWHVSAAPQGAAGGTLEVDVWGQQGLVKQSHPGHVGCYVGWAGTHPCTLHSVCSCKC